MEASAGIHAREGRVADPEEVRRALNALGEAELIKLHELAGFLAFPLRGRSWGIGEEDLLQEAVLRLLRGTRKWRPEKVDLVGLLGGIMESIVSALRKSAKRGEKPALECDLLVRDADGRDLPSPLQTAADSRPDPERSLIMREAQTQEQLFQEIEVLFVGDPLPSFILSEWKRGTKGPEIMSVMGLTRQQYDTAARRMYRAVEKRWPRGMPDVC
jgi:DNA-directed RNA polymerase specialized sigma24 family protein